MHIDIIFNLSVFMTMTDADKCEMKIFKILITCNLILETWTSCSLGATTAAKDYLKGWNFCEISTF